MSQTQTLCNCLPNDFITTTDGELVCKCGLIQGENHNNTSSIVSKTSLAQDYLLGGKRTNKFTSEKFINSSDDLTEISNICQGLSLPSFVYHDVWQWYQKLSPLLIMTKSKIVLFTIYTICRYNNIPLDESELEKRTMMNFHTKNPLNSLKIISKAFSFIDKDGITVLEKVGFTNFINTDESKFLLFSKLKSFEEKYPQEFITQIKNVCFEILLQFPKDPQSVRVAIKIALKRCGLR